MKMFLVLYHTGGGIVTPLKGTVTQVLQVEINLNLALRGKNRKGDVFRIFDFGREHR